jgi:hypothetical protein
MALPGFENGARWVVVLCAQLAAGSAWADTGLLASVDADADGVDATLDPDDAQCDADGDGLLDAVELGLVEPMSDAPACFQADADPATTSDPLRRDTDGGGLDDGQEDLDHNGRVDFAETDPASVADDVDGDADGWPDAVEGESDPDADGAPALADADADGDGLLDRGEPRALGDDGVLALLDADVDGDGLTDAIDGFADPDGDGVAALFDTDADGDGLPDAIEGADDLDGDRAGCHVDVNCDGDRRLDRDEASGDRDCDGTPDARDPDDEDGFCATPADGEVDDAPYGEPFSPAGPPSASGCAVGGGGSGSAWLAALALLASRRAAGRRLRRR